MNPRYIWALAVLVIILILGFIFWPKGNSKPIEENVTVKTPLVKLSGGMHATSTPADGSGASAIQGDSYLKIPTEIALGNDTRATIYFPDGSEARLIEGTKMSIDKASYSSETETLNVGMTLSDGHIWSKIIELATPASTWEVKTSNTVATVRGTAFDIAVRNGKTSLVTMSRKVALTVTDPDTGKVLKENAVMVEEGKMIEISSDEIDLIKENRILNTKPFLLPEDPTKNGWFTSNQRIDLDLDKKIEEIKKEGVEGALLRDKLWQDVLPVSETTTGRLPEVKNDVDITPTIEDKSLPKTVEPVKNPVVEKREPVAEPVKRLADPIRIEVDSLTPYAELMEGQTHAFRATLFRSDGTREDVTLKSTWQAIGSIGSFVSPGKFVGKLDEQGQELGERTGTVAATWTDPVSGEGFLDKSPMFKVKFNPDTVDGRAI
ncbi:MAG: FecR domain-containing protein [Candidatus Vogelbacteria bacterium]|nr:FecR domain-containing protein [Candidatus Vogelbacteria bacterium]